MSHHSLARVMFKQVLRHGDKCFLEGIEVGQSHCAYQVYTDAMKAVLPLAIKCPHVQSELKQSVWVPVRDYRSPFIPNRVPPIEDIFAFCHRDGSVTMNEYHEYKTRQGYSQWSPMLGEAILKYLS